MHTNEAIQAHEGAEAARPEPITLYKTAMLDRRVLVVADVDLLGDDPMEWAAYVGAISDDTVTKEDIDEVAGRGTKLPYQIARLIFPDCGKIRYRR